MLNVLLTNDDGIEAEGLQAMRRALACLAGVRLVVIAPDGNRSAMARSITTNRPLWVQEVSFDDSSAGYCTDGTPVDCVRLASLGLVDGFAPHVVVSGINHGNNLGDDITYSGTVAAALEGLLLGQPAVAVSQQLPDAESGDGDRALFERAASFAARLVERLGEVPMPDGTLLNVNLPAGDPSGVEVARLGRRVYRDELQLEHEESGPPARRRYWIYGRDPGFHDEEGTDLAAVAAGRIAVTPLHFDLTYAPGVGPLRSFDLASLMHGPPTTGPLAGSGSDATRR